jgi:hypothetical protein
MAAFSVITQAVGGLLKPIGEYFSRRQEIKADDRQQERAIQKALTERQIALIEQGLTADMSWEMEFAKQANTSWKDEYVLLVLSVPMVMAFIPGASQYVEMGFKAFASTPLWYQIMLQTVFYATYGIRMWRRQQSDT